MELLGLAFALQVLRISVPYVLAAMGGTLSERSGVVNLALEGMLLAGAFAATVGSFVGGAATGVLVGALGGLLVAALYGWVVLRFGADQIVAGVAINLLVLGASRYLLKLIFNSASSSPNVPGFDSAGWAGLFIGLTALAVVAIHAWLMQTPGGLRLRAVGDQPHAAHSLGVDVLATRWRAVLASGVLAGLGGAWLALDNHGFVDRMSGGRGYIAIAAMIFGRWQPLLATAACLLFGLADALQLNLQTSATVVPREWVQILPYALTMIALVGIAGRSRPPAALGTPFGRN